METSMEETKEVFDQQVVPETVHLSRLVIGAQGKLTAPDGKRLTLTVNGVSTPCTPGTYEGDVVLTVTDEFIVRTVRFGEITDANYRMAVCVKDGKYLPQHSVAAAVQGGQVGDGQLDGITIESNEWDFNGVYVTGDGAYTINDINIHFVGDGTDDFVGLGAGIAASGNAKLTVNRANIRTEGITRGALFVGGNSEVTVRDSELSLQSYVPTPEQLAEGAKLQRMMEPPWAMSIRGNGRTLNLGQFGKATFERCHITSNSWGVLSVDGAQVNRMYVKDSLIELIGTSGYGSFSIADDLNYDYHALGELGCLDVFDHTEVRVPTYGIIMSLGTAGGEYKNGSKVFSGRHGAFIFRNSGSLKVSSGSGFYTKECSFLVKGSNVTIEADDAHLEPENGVILRLMDNDDTGMEGYPFLVPVGETDVPEPGRDLTQADPLEDVFVTLSNLEATGDLYNSTTNLKACMRVPPRPADAPPLPDPGQVRGFIGDGLQGAKNLDLHLINAKLTGRISSAKAAYAPGVTKITKENCEELGEITETVAPAINNGVILTLEGDSCWTVTGKCYLTALNLGEHATIRSSTGTLRLLVNGVEAPLMPANYRGSIELLVE
jgi:hypothetical protein